MKTTLFALILLVSVQANAEEGRSSASVEVGGGNGGASVTISPKYALVPGIYAIGGVSAGLGLQPTYLGGSALSPSLSLSGGLLVDGKYVHANWYLAFKCEPGLSSLPADKTKEYGCGTRGGARVFLGESKGVQVGVGVSSPLGSVTHGEDFEYEILLKIPLSANDAERSNDKNDLERHDPKKEMPTSKAVSA